jgi:myo-inositol-1(or 4)-monophosphatase
MENNIKKVAVEAVKKTGKILLKEFKSYDRHNIKLKNNREAVTECDLQSEKIIINAIQNNFLGHSVLSEEVGFLDNKSEYLWILDPIDGTTSFTEHSPLWCISLAVAYKEELILGVIYIPVLDELFIAEKGRGATLNGQKIHVSNINTGKTLNTFCHARGDKDIKRMLKYFNYQKINHANVQQLGSAAIELCYTAAGRIDSFAAFGANAWDVAAGAVIVKEAGGMVTNFTGQDWTIKSHDILASNGKVHRNIMDIINKKLKIK